MTTALTVRAARLDDLDTIVELRLALLREHSRNPLYANLRKDAESRAHELFRSQLLAANETMLIAERGTRIVGLLRCVETYSSPLLFPERYCYVSSAFVRPEARGQGVLRALLGAAERWCQERGLDEMRLHNSADAEPAQQAWSRLGFEIVEQVRRRPLHPAAQSRSPLRHRL